MGLWTGLAPSSTGNGFFVTASNRGVTGCGDAVPLGGLAAQPVTAPVVGIAATPDGKGYRLAGADGGVFSFGSAPFEGSEGGTRRVVSTRRLPGGVGQGRGYTSGLGSSPTLS